MSLRLSKCIVLCKEFFVTQISRGTSSNMKGKKFRNSILLSYRQSKL